MAMHGVVACCTQTGNRERRVSVTVYLVCLPSSVFLILCVQERLCELVKLMGGHVSADFTRHVSRYLQVPSRILFAYLCILLMCAQSYTVCIPLYTTDVCTVIYCLHTSVYY